MQFLAANLLFSPLKWWKRICRYQPEAVKMNIAPLKTANITKIHRQPEEKIYSNFKQEIHMVFAVSRGAFLSHYFSDENITFYTTHSPQKIVIWF